MYTCNDINKIFKYFLYIFGSNLHVPLGFLTFRNCVNEELLSCDYIMISEMTIDC